MSPRRLGKGSQKKARFERLKNEIMRFVTANPGCSAQSIVANLSHDRVMRNHGLTPRKVGFFIPRHLADRRLGGRIIAQEDESTGVLTKTTIQRHETSSLKEESPTNS